MTKAGHLARLHRRSSPGAGCVVGLLFAAVSVYWGLDGTWLLDTLDDRLEEPARAGQAGVFIAVWAAALLTTIAPLVRADAAAPCGAADQVQSARS